MRRFPHPSSLAVLVALVAGGPAGAVDLTRMSKSERGIYCLVYIDMAGQYAASDGLISEQQRSDKMSRAVMKVQGRGRSPDFILKLDRAWNAVAGEKPTTLEVLRQADTCEDLLRL